jgi:hypothetical protein
VILPTKHVRTPHSLVGFGAGLLDALDHPMSVSELRERALRTDRSYPYDRFLLALDFLFAVRAIRFSEGVLVRESTTT